MKDRKKSEPAEDELEQTEMEPPADPVDEASDESFPASDPPAWTETTASKNSRPR